MFCDLKYTAEMQTSNKNCRKVENVKKSDKRRKLKRNEWPGDMLQCERYRGLGLQADRGTARRV
jgi:hypothetical protein